MPTFNVLVKGIRKNELLSLRIEQGSQAIERDLFWTEIDSKIKFAKWLLAQTFPTDTVEISITKAFTIEAHQEQVIDPETGQTVDIWVVDSVASAPLPEDDAQAGIENLPGWATWTAQEATDWIDTNVVDLASAKVAITAMAKMVVYLRDLALRSMGAS